MHASTRYCTLCPDTPQKANLFNFFAFLFFAGVLVCWYVT